MKLKKRNLKKWIISLIFLTLIVAIIGYSYSYMTKESYIIKEDKAIFSKYRGELNYQMTLKENNSNYSVWKISFESKRFLTHETIIHGLLFLPNSDKKVPGVVLLPGGGVTKESESKVASIIANLGYGVLTFDQRGIGETGGYYLSFEDDFQVFSDGEIPIQQLSVYDALKAFDVLKDIKEIDSDNIILMGESMGGRYSLIAAALDKRIKGYIGISTGGFHYKEQGANFDLYFKTIDPDNYAEMIAPRKMIMIHGDKDNMIPIESAKITFDKARDPKELIIINGCGHGYCDEMFNALNKSLYDIITK